MTKIFLLLLSLGVIAFPAASRADTIPWQVLEDNIAKITEIMQAPGSRNESREKETKEKIMVVIERNERKRRG